MPQYLIIFNDEWVPEHTPEQLAVKATASQAVLAEMRQQGALVWSNGGIGADSAIGTMRAVDGIPEFTAGPYSHTEEHPGGFCVVNVADDDQACYWAGRIAMALDWPQEVHRFRGLGHVA